ncbi:unnamed protein product, partial [marine sediment metagenome]
GGEEGIKYLPQVDILDPKPMTGKSIKIYVDGGCSGNPGPGAWAYIILYDNSRIKASCPVPSTTNNRMELSAVISALKEAHKHSECKKAVFEVYTDSKYVEQGITSWIDEWERNGWLNKKKKPVKNQDLWKSLRELSRPLSISWRWLQGHAGHELNEECDRMVQKAIKELK